METRDLRATRKALTLQPWSERRTKAIICKQGPSAVLDTCMMHLGGETEVEHVLTLAEAMRRCLEGGVDILYVNLFSVTARELTALAAFRSMAPRQRIVAVTGADMKPVVLVAGLADEVVEVEKNETKYTQPRA